MKISKSVRNAITTLVVAFCIIVVGTSLSGCETAEEKELRRARQHELELARIESGYYEQLNKSRHEERMAYYNRPVAPGAYVDYRGNLQYGYWNAFGNWEWHDPNSIYAQQSRNYVSYQIATGVLAASAAYALTRNSWESSNPGGWRTTNVTVNNYTSSEGKSITEADYRRRKSSSDAMYNVRKRKYTETKQTVSSKIKSKPKTTDTKPKTQSSSVAQGGWGSKKTGNKDSAWNNCTTTTCKKNRAAANANAKAASSTTTQTTKANQTITTRKPVTKATASSFTPKPTSSYTSKPKLKPKPKPAYRPKPKKKSKR